MDVQSVSRWDKPTSKTKSKQNNVLILTAVLVGVVIVFGVSHLFSRNDDEAKSPVQTSKSDANESGSAIGALTGPSRSELGETVAKLVARVDVLQVENQRLAVEMSQLVDHDGVIERLVTHVRALHAQSEATRRDVVNALMEPIQNSDRQVGLEGLTQTPSLEGEANSLLTKARHMIVTPVVVTSPAAVAAAEKHKAKPSPDEPEEGNTN